ncbi:hypothetical protein PoB_000154800 [Plakobranchus ocellatus]|uniref:MRG domain-containing protein n=1 Tax=Plakobranchus ocellatus TaxID=259542 RepID=A0AAV3XXR8_9GAST|nr:hypothetical protein PoB_000154800 [Plakobranchus ocellatus]
MTSDFQAPCQARATTKRSLEIARQVYYPLCHQCLQLKKRTQPSIISHEKQTATTLPYVHLWPKLPQILPYVQLLPTLPQILANLFTMDKNLENLLRSFIAFFRNNLKDGVSQTGPLINREQSNYRADLLSLGIFSFLKPFCTYEWVFVLFLR